jgi:AcrR family transcriptional regulator
MNAMDESGYRTGGEAGVLDAGKPPPRRRLAPDARREQILQEAIALLTDKGIDFNTRELSDRLGISHPLLFRYFASKEEIIEAVFQTVYLGRFSPEMRRAIEAAHDDVVAKWIDFYRVYAPKIFDRTWIRIFISSALNQQTISRRYFEIVINPLIAKMADDTEIHCFGATLPVDSPIRVQTLELAWMTHSSLFYSGLRRWVYDLAVPSEIVETMAVRIKVHFAGARAVLVRGQHSL